LISNMGPRIGRLILFIFIHIEILMLESATLIL